MDQDWSISTQPSNTWAVDSTHHEFRLKGQLTSCLAIHSFIHSLLHSLNCLLSTFYYRVLSKVPWQPRVGDQRPWELTAQQGTDDLASPE